MIGVSYPALFSSARIDGVRAIVQSDDAGVTWKRIDDDAHQYAFTGEAISRRSARVRSGLCGHQRPRRRLWRKGGVTVTLERRGG
jgi:hypothetical protein